MVPASEVLEDAPDDAPDDAPAEVPAEPTRCAVCLQPCVGAADHTLECGHAFHTNCIVHWFRCGGGTCPVCRAKPLGEVGWETVTERAGRMLRRSRQKKASAALRSKAERYTAARDSYRNLRATYTAFRRQHSGTLREHKRLWRKMWQQQRRVIVSRETLGAHDLESEGLQARFRRLSAPR